MNRPSIGGVLDNRAYTRLHFHTLERTQQVQAIHRLAATGHGEYTIAGITGLSVEMIRRVLAESDSSATP